MTYHNILKQKYNNWAEIEAQIEALPTIFDRGEAFEQFVYAYFSIHKNLYQISELYREKDIPLKYRDQFKLEKRDSGVDGLIIFNDGRSAGYQVKFRVKREIPSYAELSKFWVEAKHTDYNYTIANCYYLTKLAKKNEKHKSILVNELEDLTTSFFTELNLLVNTNRVVKINFSPDKFQQKMIDDCVNGFKENNRGKLIAACGTGKTLAALWITEALQSKNVLFLAPSLALIKQTLEAWSMNSKDEFSYLCVCSDKSVSDDVEDNGDITLEDFNIPVTTSPEIINNYVNNKGSKKKVIFSTYQSLDVLTNGLKQSSNFKFNITIFDEAHRTAGAKNSKLFSLALHDDNINSEKRLFMTATERLVRPWIVKKAAEYERIVFSMDDEAIYGKLFHRFDFGQAIDNAVIADYRIIVAGVRQSEVSDLIKANKWLVNSEGNSEEHFTSGQNLFRQLLLLKSMQEFPISKIITFHSEVKKAKQFIYGIDNHEVSLKLLFEKLWKSLNPNDLYFEHVNGEMNAGERKERTDRFQEAKFGILSNARCLTEGVDVPLIDAVYFVNPKNSLVDIVQACGRALRKPRQFKTDISLVTKVINYLKPQAQKKEKIAYFIVPMIIPDEAIENQDIVNEIDFEMLYNLIQSLRDQDKRLSEWVDKLNFEATKGKISSFSKGSDSPIIFKLPQEINLKNFKQSLYLRIAEVNANPVNYGYKSKKYGRKERKSNYKRIFKTIGDMAVNTYQNNLVDPTIGKFGSKYDVLSSSELEISINGKISHNNISHTERLGLTIKQNGKYNLSPIGVQYFEKRLDFKTLFCKQMLRYYSVENDNGQQRILFPYRACLRILLNVKRINFIEFVFCIYSLLDSSNESAIEAIEGINFIRANYPNLEITNEKNKVSVLKELNEYFETNYSLTEVWTKATTIYNQYIYFRNHLKYLEDIIDNDSSVISLKENKEGELRILLSSEDKLEKENSEDKLKSVFVSNIVMFVVFSLLHN